MIPVQRSTELSTIAREEGARQIVIAGDDYNAHVYCYESDRLVVWVSKTSVAVEQHSLWQRWLP